MAPNFNFNFTLDKFENLIKDCPHKSLKYAVEIEQRFEKGEKPKYELKN